MSPAFEFIPFLIPLALLVFSLAGLIYFDKDKQ